MIKISPGTKEIDRVEVLFGFIDQKKSIPEEELQGALQSLSQRGERSIESVPIPQGILAMANGKITHDPELQKIVLLSGFDDESLSLSKVTFEDGTLTLESDQLGTRPLYYYQTSDFFAFCTEIEPLLCLSAVPKAPNPDAIDTYLKWGMTLGESTFVKSIFNLPVASRLKFNFKEGLKVFTKSPDSYEVTFENPAFDLIETFKKSLYQWIEKYNIRTANLSGGADTRLILACLEPEDRKNFLFITDASPYLKREEDKDVLGAQALAQQFGLKWEIRDHEPRDVTDDRAFKRHEPVSIPKLSGNHGGEILGGDLYGALAFVDQSLFENFLWGCRALFHPFFTDIYGGGVFNHWTTPGRFSQRKCAPFWSCGLALKLSQLPLEKVRYYNIYADIYRNFFPEFMKVPFNSPLATNQKDFPILETGTNPKDSFKRPSVNEMLERESDHIRSVDYFDEEKMKEELAAGQTTFVLRKIKCNKWLFEKLYS